MGKYLKIVQNYERSGQTAAPRTSQAKPRPSSHHPQDIQQISELGAVIESFSQRNGSNVFCFTSSRKGEGVSSVTANVARLMAVTQPLKSILVIDCNHQHPFQHVVFGIPESPGLCDGLAGSLRYSKCVHKVNPNGLHVIPYGSAKLNMSLLLENGQFGALISEVNNNYGITLIDCPPVLDSAYSLMIADASDIVLLVVQANRTQWEVAQKAKNHLEAHNCQIGGVVLNRVLRVIPEWIYRSL